MLAALWLSSNGSKIQNLRIKNASLTKKISNKQGNYTNIWSFLNRFFFYAFYYVYYFRYKV